MPDKTDSAAEAAAEKAYAAATEALPLGAPSAPEATSAEIPAEAAAEPEVVFPSKTKRSPKARAEAPATAAPAVAAKADVPAAPPKATPSTLKASALKASTVRRAEKVAPKKLKKAKPVVRAKALPKAKPIAPQPSASHRAAPAKSPAPKSLIQQLKDKTMDTTEFATKIKGAVTEAQTKAKQAFDKGAETFGEYNEFTKGNAEAVVASGKILATGMQSLGKTFVEDGKAALDLFAAEVKELAAVKSPTEFFKLQAEFLHRNFDVAVSNTSKNSEAVLKLASEAAAPISARVNLAVEKVKQAA
jgi:phasin family protein